MSLLGLKIYTVHMKSGETLAERKPIFIREGFNIFAFIFTLFWTLYHRLWRWSLLILAVNVVLALATKNHLLDTNTGSIIQIAFNVLVGFHANDWLRDGLARRGYVMADVTAADSLLRAEQRYFERSLAVA